MIECANHDMCGNSIDEQDAYECTVCGQKFCRVCIQTADHADYHLCLECIETLLTTKDRYGRIRDTIKEVLQAIDKINLLGLGNVMDGVAYAENCRLIGYIKGLLQIEVQEPKVRIEQIEGDEK